MKQASGASSLNFGLGYIYILIHYDLRMQAAMALASLLCFVLFDSLRPINNLSVEQAQVFLGWTSTKLGLMCLAQGPQRSDAREARTRRPSVSSQALYHWATVLPWQVCTFVQAYLSLHC